MKYLRKIVLCLWILLAISMTSCVPHSEYGSENYNTIDFVGTHCMRQYTCTNGNQYFYYVAGKIYEFQEGKKDIVVTDQVGEIQGMACDRDFLYYSDGNLYRVNLKDKAKRELNNSGYVTSIVMDEANLFYCKKIPYTESGETEYGYEDIYVLDGRDLLQNPVNLNDLFMKRDSLPTVQEEIQDTYELYYKDYILSAFYDKSLQHYEIDSVFEKNSGKLIASYETTPCQTTINYKEKPLTVKRGGYKQGIKGKWNEIKLLQYAAGYDMLSFNPRQIYCKFDLLMTWSPKKPEGEMIYRAFNEKTKIIGYVNDQVYLYRNNKVIRKNPTMEKENIIDKLVEEIYMLCDKCTKNEKVVCKLPKETYMLFDWCDGKLFIFGGEDEENARLLEVVSK